MSHQDQGRLASIAGLQQALAWLLGPGTFGSWKFRDDCSWTPTTIASMILLWAWREERAITDRFFSARQTILQTLPEQQQLAGTYQAFIKMLRRHTPLLLFAIVEAIQRHMQRSLRQYFQVAGYTVFGVDGTRVAVPRTAENERAFASTYRSRGRKSRRGRRRREAERKAAICCAWLTTLWHVGTGLPWRWERGASFSSEREHLLKMLPSLPEKSLITADAGFTGYDVWQTLLEKGHHLLIRVGSNVKLLKRLGCARERCALVYLWPDKQARLRQPPLKLRLVIAHEGKHPMYLVTSVLSSQDLSDRQLIELYRARWGVEVFYRTFKQTFARRKLLSGCPQNALLELDWSLAGLLAACLYAKWVQHQEGHPPTRISVAGVLRIIRRAMQGILSGGRVPTTLQQQLGKALVDTYVRKNKASRDYPVKKPDRPHTSPPIICTANKSQIRLAAEIRHEKGLTA